MTVTTGLCAASLSSLTLLFALLLAPAAKSQTPSDVSRVLSSSFATSLAVDSSGNVFYVGTNSPAITYTADGVYELMAVDGVVPANPTVRTLASAGGTIVTPVFLTLDGKGNVYVVDSSDESIKELTAVNGAVPDNASIRTILSGIRFYGFDITVDGSGDLFFISDAQSQTVDYAYIYELTAVNGSVPTNPTPVTLFTSECDHNNGCVEGNVLNTLKADKNGNLFLIYNDGVSEFPAANGSITPGETPRLVVRQPGDSCGLGVASDGSVFFCDVTSSSGGFGSLIEEVAAVDGVIPANPTPVALYSASNDIVRPYDMAADNNGNVFVANSTNAGVQNILEIEPGSGTGAGAAAALTPATSNFGGVAVGSSAAATFTLANAGAAALSISSVALGGTNAGSFVVGTKTCGAMLAAGASCTIVVSFAPKSAGTASATLSVVDAVGTQSAALTGNGSTPAAPQAELSPASAAFGNVTLGASSAQKTFTLGNSGNAALALSSVSLRGTNAADFSISGNTCETSLAAGSSCTITVAFKPSVAASETATVSVLDSVGAQTSTLSGVGVAAASSADFGITASPDGQTAEAGSSVDYSVDVESSVGTFNQPVSLTASGLPPGATVTFSPATVTPGSSGATSTMTIHTAALSARNHASSLEAPLEAPMLAMLLCIPIGLRRRPARWVLGLTIIIAAGALQGCNGGFALPQSSMPQTEAYTVTVTGASGTTQHSTQLHLTIQSGAT